MNGIYHRVITIYKYTKSYTYLPVGVVLDNAVG